MPVLEGVDYDCPFDADPVFPEDAGLYGWGGAGRDRNELGFVLIPPLFTIPSEKGRLLPFDWMGFGSRAMRCVSSGLLDSDIGIVGRKLQRHALRIARKVHACHRYRRLAGECIETLDLAQNQLS